MLDGVLFSAPADTVLIAITGIHGNFYSNPFYYNIGDTLNAAGIDFIYAQTNDAFGQIETRNVRTGRRELIGSWNEDFGYTDEDIEGYLDFAWETGYKHIILAGHSLGANKVIYYLSRHHDQRVEHFVFLSPANIGYLTGVVTEREKQIIRQQVEGGEGDKLLPFPLLGWINCIGNTAYQWVFDNILDNVHVERDIAGGSISPASLKGREEDLPTANLEQWPYNTTIHSCRESQDSRGTSWMVC